MKIRNGFVSNSSSSSFCIYGVMLHRDEVDSIIKEISSKLESYISEHKKDEEWCEWNYDEDPDNKNWDPLNGNCSVTYISEMFEYVFGIDAYPSEEGECMLIGRSPESMPDIKTIGLIKEETKLTLSDEMKIRDEPHWIITEMSY